MSRSVVRCAPEVLVREFEEGRLEAALLALVEATEGLEHMSVAEDLVWRRGFPHAPALRELATTLREAWPQAAPPTNAQGEAPKGKARPPRRP